MQQRNAGNARLIDVSINNGPINWSHVKAFGVAGGWAKATEGASGKDSLFYQNYIGMQKVGIVRGAYAFARPATSTALQEADALIDRVLAAGGFDGLDPVLDLEDAGGKSPYALATFILTFEARVRLRTGQSIILYTYTSFIEEHLAPVVSRINHLPLWLADYGSSVPRFVPGWNRWTFLQHSETGTVPGIDGHVDLDEYDGTPIQFISKFMQGGGVTLNTEQVKQLQTNLIVVLKLPVDPKTWADGLYGPATTAAVKSFQYLNKLQATGQPDSATISALNKAVATVIAPKPSAPPVTPVIPATNAKRDQAAQLIQQGLEIIKTL